MNDLEKMALVLIYPDGEVEKIPITSYVFHIEYMIKQRTVSQRFARVTLNCDFTDSLHEDIDTALVINGIIVLFNLSIYDIVRYSNFLDENKPDFGIYFPSRLGSMKQILEYEKIMNNYPLENKSAGLFNPDTNLIDDIDPYQVEEFLKNEKSLFSELSL